jgi:hypothetical protein
MHCSHFTKNEPNFHHKKNLFPNWPTPGEEVFDHELVVVAADSEAMAAFFRCAGAAAATFVIIAFAAGAWFAVA